MTPEREQELLLQITMLTAERDQLLREKEGTQAWLGSLVYGSPISPTVDPDFAFKKLADELVTIYPDKKIQAIKEMRTRAATIPGQRNSLGLKEAKDFIDAAFTRADMLVANNGMVNPSALTGYRGAMKVLVGQDHIHNCIPITVGLIKGRLIPVPLRKQYMWVCIHCDLRTPRDLTGIQNGWESDLDRAREEAIAWELEIERDDANERFGWIGCKSVYLIEEEP